MCYIFAWNFLLRILLCLTFSFCPLCLCSCSDFLFYYFSCDYLYIDPCWPDTKFFDLKPIYKFNSAPRLYIQQFYKLVTVLSNALKFKFKFKFIVFLYFNSMCLSSSTTKDDNKMKTLASLHFCSVHT